MLNTYQNEINDSDNSDTLNRHVLLVEDDDALLLATSDLLEIAGYQVSKAVDGADGLKKLEEMPMHPDVIVSDIRMPNIDGYQFFDMVKARSEWLAIPFIFLTAKGEKEDIRDGKLRGVDDYLTKPFEFKDLLVSVKACIIRNEALAEHQEVRFEDLRRRILIILNHEFRTPLSLIVAYSDLMMHSPTFQHSDELRQYIDGIQEGSERLFNLVESFLILAELESGHGKSMFDRRKKTVYDASKIVNETIETFRGQASRLAIDLQFEVDEPLPIIVSETSYLTLAIKHLIANAIKFSPKDVGAIVKIHLYQMDDYLVIEVEDRGRGIPPEEKNAIFSLFQQIDREEYEDQGAGIGLAIVSHVAKLHHGMIRVESQFEKGSIFRLLIPAVEEVNV